MDEIGTDPAGLALGDEPPHRFDGAGAHELDLQIGKCSLSAATSFPAALVAIDT